MHSSGNDIKVSPPPINKVIVDSAGIPTQIFIRYLLDLRKTSLRDTSIINEIIDDITELQNGIVIVNASVSTLLKVQSQIVLVDASGGDINIFLPPPNECFNDDRSLGIAVHKIDSTENIVTILPNDSELIVGESSQSVEFEGEILNFISDNTNWYLGA